MKKLQSYLSLMRPKQWVKNLLIFLPLFFGLKLGNIEYLSETTIAFVLFSMVASSIYIFNDIKDVEEDRRHYAKKKRPIASCLISIPQAYVTMAILLIVGCFFALLVDIRIAQFMIAYFILNILYTIKLKRISIIDTFVIAIGFVIRLYIGSITAHVTLSMWIVLMTFLLAIFLALSKRKDDIIIFENTGKETRKNIHGYTVEFLNLSMVIMASIVMVSYIMYTTSASTILMRHGDKLYLTAIFVLLGIMRYMQINIVTDESKTPTEILYADKTIQFSIIGWIMALFFIMY